MLKWLIRWLLPLVIEEAADLYREHRDKKKEFEQQKINDEKSISIIQRIENHN